MDLEQTKTNFRNWTNHLSKVNVIYKKNGVIAEQNMTEVETFLDSITTFLAQKTSDVHHVEYVWTGKTTFMYGIEMYFAAIISEDVGMEDENTSQMAINISSSPLIMKEGWTVWII